VGLEGIREDSYGGEGFAGHLVEKEELREGIGRVGVKVDVFGVAHIQDGRVRAFDAPGECTSGVEKVCGVTDGRLVLVGDKKLDGRWVGFGASRRGSSSLPCL
jgi:hypothetical protein